MNSFQQTAVFAEWLHELADKRGKAQIAARIDGAKAGNFGDCAPVGDGISEMRIHVGPGYRVYFMRDGYVVYLLLCGGDKSTQKTDIARAKEMAALVRAGRAEAAAQTRSAAKKAPTPKAPAKSKGMGMGMGKGKARKG